MNNLVKDLLIGLQPTPLVTMILLILLAGCDYHGMPSDVRKSFNLYLMPIFVILVDIKDSFVHPIGKV